MERGHRDLGQLDGGRSFGVIPTRGMGPVDSTGYRPGGITLVE